MHRKRRMNDRVDKDGGLQAGGERRGGGELKEGGVINDCRLYYEGERTDTREEAEP